MSDPQWEMFCEYQERQLAALEEIRRCIVWRFQVSTPTPPPAPVEETQKEEPFSNPEVM